MCMYTMYSTYTYKHKLSAMEISQEVKERVLAAIDKLVSEGVEEPTNKQILATMGKGSYSHVSPVASTWRQQRKEKLKEAMALPDELQSLLGRAGSEIWAKAQTIAGIKYQQIKEDCDKRIEDAKSEKNDAIAEIVRLESVVEDKDAKIANLISENETICLGLEKLKQSKVDIEQALNAIKSDREQARIELARKTAKLEQVQQQLTSSKGDYDKLQQQLIDLAKGK